MQTCSKIHRQFISLILLVLTFQIAAQKKIVINHQPSNAEQKMEITPLDGSYSKIRKLEGICFRWNEVSSNDTTVVQTGFHAQEVEKLFPELIEEDSLGYKSMDYLGLIPHMVEAIKMLEMKVEQLETSNSNFEELETRLRILENTHKRKHSRTQKKAKSNSPKTRKN